MVPIPFITKILYELNLISEMFKCMIQKLGWPTAYLSYHVDVACAGISTERQEHLDMLCCRLTFNVR